MELKKKNPNPLTIQDPTMKKGTGRKGFKVWENDDFLSGNKTAWIRGTYILSDL